MAARRWLPNVEDFFSGLSSLIETSETNFNSASYDNAEFLYRRLDAHERTLSTLLMRIEQAYVNTGAQTQARTLPINVL